MRVYCAACAAGVADAEYEELTSMADDTVCLWPDHRGDENRAEDVRPVPCRIDYAATWDAYRILSNRAFDLLFRDDFKTSNDCIEAFVMLWNASNILIDASHEFKKF